ncbi:MAG: FtsW/RodA/SpoVE family cell cycle protein [Oscillospiraceae bacterium]|nr:FtsW/RodA/SpoVE family cell cycle protein [Oscillospiraceae bacterium]
MKILDAFIAYFKKLDKLLLLFSVALSAFSVVLLHSIVVNGVSTIVLTSSLYRNQAIITAASIAVALIICAIDYHSVIKLWVLYAPLAILLSLLVFTDLGIEVADDRAWIDLKIITLQPSELLKITFITTFALHLSKVGDKINEIGHVLLLALHAALPAAIVLAQGDDGTACVFIMIFVIMMYAAGISWFYIIPCVIALPAGIWFVWEHVMKDFQKMRFLVLTDDELDPLGVGYHQRVSKLALGSGQVFGKGLHASDYVKVPEAANDFIFTYVGQCFGFVGCIAVMAVLLFIAVKILVASRVARDPLGKLICTGVFAMIVTHCILNLGMVFGMLPVIGVPLPYLSQGGTSVLSVYIGIGLVMSTTSHSEKKYRMFYDPDKKN